MAHRAVISLRSSPCCVQFLTPVALHVSCLFEIEKHFRHALCCWPGNTAQAELTAWAVRTFLSEIQRSNSETINAWREFSCGIVVFLMFSNVPFSEWGHACGQLRSGCFGWLSNCDLGEWCRSCSPPCRAPLPPEPAAGALQPMARQAAGVFGPQRWAVSVLTQSPSQDQPRAGVVPVVVPFLAVHCAAGPSHLLTSQGQSSVGVGELVNAPKMYCVLVFAKYFPV